VPLNEVLAIFEPGYIGVYFSVDSQRNCSLGYAVYLSDLFLSYAMQGQPPNVEYLNPTELSPTLPWVDMQAVPASAYALGDVLGVSPIVEVAKTVVVPDIVSVQTLHSTRP